MDMIFETISQSANDNFVKNVPASEGAQFAQMYHTLDKNVLKTNLIS